MMRALGVDAVKNLHDCRGITLVGEPLLLEVAAYKVDKLVLKLCAHSPDFVILNLEDTIPGLGVALVGKHLFAELIGIESLPFAGGPGRHVHTVGHITYVAFLPRVALPQTGKHLL